MTIAVKYYGVPLCQAQAFSLLSIVIYFDIVYIIGDIICSCGSDGNAVLWKSTTDLANRSDSTESMGYTKARTLSHGDQQIYSCETLGCIPSAHIMTASEDSLHFWDLSDSSGVEQQTLCFDKPQEGTGSTPHVITIAHCRSM